MDFFDPAVPTGTSPALVELLIERLYARGYESVTVFDGRNIDDSWLHNRSPLSVPDLVGYRFRVNGGDYDVVSLNEDLSHEFLTHGHPLNGSHICRQWAKSEFRIVFAKNKTDEEFGFALGVYNLLSCIHHKLRAAAASADIALADLCVALLRKTPIHFCLIDAIVSSDGIAGSRIAAPVESNTIIGSASILLADWVGATKMGVDPYVSPINATALREIGLPRNFHVEGELCRYPTWKNARPYSTKPNHPAEAGFMRLARPLLQPVDREAFPFKDLRVDHLNRFLTRYLANREARNASNLLSVAMYHACTFMDNAVECINMMHQKENIRRIVRPPEFDYLGIPKSRYDDIRDHVASTERFLLGAPEDKHGHIWRYVDSAVLFRGTRVIARPFAEFVQAVDISRAIQFLNDYIGGGAVSISTTRDGRVTRQAERNLYLPQPNWTVLFGGKMIDVEKIELIEYKKNVQRLSWQTVHSPNNTAELDDGSVEFRRTSDGLTKVTVFTHQRFNLPPTLQMLQIQNHPEIHDFLVGSAYKHFFANTIHNLTSKADGIPFQIGREASSASSVVDLSVWVASLAAAILDLIGDQEHILRSIGKFFAPVRSQSELDEFGFRHFQGGQTNHSTADDHGLSMPELMRSIASEAPTFMAGLADAIQKDVAVSKRSFGDCE